MNIYQTIVLIFVLGFTGCATARDLPKTIWGSSTRVLEQNRTNALSKTYDKNYWDCIKTAMKVAKDNGYLVFKKDEVRGIFIFMGIPGAVDTTEVGVFFIEVADEQTRIELSSLSTHAKRILAKGLFHGMDVEFGLVAPDVEEVKPVIPEKTNI